MKHRYFFVCALLIIAQSAFAQKAVTLDQAISDITDYFLARIPEGTNVAIINFDVASDKIAGYVIDSITKHFVDNGKITVVDRQYLDAAKRELNLSVSGDVSDESAQRIGHFIGAEIVLVGSLVEHFRVYRMQVRGINVETAKVIGIENKNVQPKDIENLFGEKKVGADTGEFKIGPLFFSEAVAFTAGSSNYGWEFFTLGAGAGAQATLTKNLGLRLYGFIGGGLSKTKWDSPLYIPYHFGGGFDVILMNKVVLGFGGGMAGDFSNRDKDLYPFIRGIIGSIDKEGSIFKFYYDYNFFDNGFRMGVISSFIMAD